LFFSFVLKVAYAQNRAIIESFNELQSAETVDSLRRLLLSDTIQDSSRVHAIHRLTYPYIFSKPDSAMILAQEGLKLASSINYTKGEILCKTDIGAIWWVFGDYTKAGLIVLENLESAERLNDPEAIEWTLSFVLTVYRDQGDPAEAIKYVLRGVTMHEYFSKKMWNTIAGSVYLKMKEFDSSLVYLQQGDMGGYNLLLLGDTYMEMGNHVAAMDYYEQSIRKLDALNNFKDMALVYAGIARLYEKEGKADSAIYTAEKGFNIAQNASFKRGVYETSNLLSKLYEEKDKGEALRYLKIAVEANDSLFNLRKITGALELRYNEQLRKKEMAVTEMNYQNRLRTIILLTVLGIFLLAVIILYRNNKQKQKAKIKIEKAYKELESTQAQLVQSEKMASLGELTAGIAHEIQNPLNFVNNFSDVNKELVEELKSELAIGNLQLAIEIAANIGDNEDKINHHGKRADSIVKGMLQHSRTSTGQKELIDINKLIDEYLRLAYHGLRAKNKSFDAEIKTDFDPSIGKINVVPQDIGRVLLNLINNAFYSVDEKQKQNLNGYGPAVTVTTANLDAKIQIKVKDNGNGIPQKILEKIFQPFFTTKPTGQGTGLGLSLAYDTIKAHGGEIKVKTKEGEGSEFIVHLPMT